MCAKFTYIKMKLPLPTETFLEKYKWILTGRERKDIKEVTDVFYYGSHLKKKSDSYKNRSKKSFRDEDGYYLYEIKDHLKFRYEILGVLGEGFYGRVLHAFDHKRHKPVAIKNVRREAYSNRPEMYNEACILSYLRDKGVTDCVVKIKDSFYFRKSYFIVCEKLLSDMLPFIQPKYERLYGDDLLRNIVYCLFRCLFYVHKNQILHGDIKPENIFITAKGKPSLKFGDFGMSCHFRSIPWHFIKPTLYYQAPEVILGGKITPAIDVWSVACVAAELATGIPIFHGTDDDEVFTAIVERLGVPPNSFLDKCDPQTTSKFVTKKGFPRYIANEIGDEHQIVNPKPTKSGRQRCFPGDKSLSILLEEEEQMLIDFIEKCLKWNVDERLTHITVFDHPYLQRHIPKYIENHFPFHLRSSALSISNKSDKNINIVNNNIDRGHSVAF